MADEGCKEDTFLERDPYKSHDTLRDPIKQLYDSMT